MQITRKIPGPNIQSRDVFSGFDFFEVSPCGSGARLEVVLEAVAPLTVDPTSLASCLVLSLDIAIFAEVRSFDFLGESTHLSCGISSSLAILE